MGGARVAAIPAFAVFGLGLACGAGPNGANGGGPLEGRFVAVHNALSAMGLVQIGPLQVGSLRPGAEARSILPLPAGCVAIVALGGEGVGDLDASLVDAHGKTLAHDTTTGPEAVLRTCLETDDSYVLVVKAAAGAGPWVAAAWAGNVGAAASPQGVSHPPLVSEANGTCDAPIPLRAGAGVAGSAAAPAGAAGTAGARVSGSTAHGLADNAGSCGGSAAQELVYELDVPARERVAIEVEAQFDSVLYLRKDDCRSAENEVACNDDGPDRAHSKIEKVLDPGKYFVFVDGYGEEAGAFKMTVNEKEVLSFSNVCRQAPVLASGTPQRGTTADAADDAQATCGNGAEGADAAWRIDVAERARVRVTEHVDQGNPVLHVRRVCADADSEVACGEGGAAPGDATVTAVLDPGAYTVFADAEELATAGPYTLALETAPLVGTATPSDGCGDAAPLSAGASGAVAGDTFTARDDVAGRCGGAGAADVVYRLDVPARSRLVASLEHEEAPHLLVAWRRCAERSAEIGCGPALNEVVDPGTYFLAVDGATPDSFGRFSLHWSLRDLSDQARECAIAPLLLPGRRVSASTAGGSNGFDTSCAVNGVAATGPDRAFRFALARSANVRVVVAAAGFDAEVELRMACPDPSFGRLPELACETSSGSGQTGPTSQAGRTVVIERPLEAGSYFVVVDGRSPKDEGPFTIEYRTLP
jgi:hypothetical protein